MPIPQHRCTEFLAPNLIINSMLILTYYQGTNLTFEKASASNGGLIEWKIALYHKEIFLADQRTFGRWRLKNWHDFSNKVV